MKYGIFVGVLVFLIVLVSGCTSSQNNTSSSNVSGIEIVINYTGPWNGTIEYGEGIKAVSGNGTQIFVVNGTPKVVTADINKMDGSTNTLKVEIRKNGVIEKNASVSGPNGGAMVSEMF